MDKKKYIQQGRLMKDLFSVSICTFDALKKEAGIPVTFGFFPLVLTP